MPKFIVRLQRPATDYLVSEIEVDADDAAAAQANVAALIDEGDAAVYDLDFRFDQCGDTGAIVMTGVAELVAGSESEDPAGRPAELPASAPLYQTDHDRGWIAKLPGGGIARWRGRGYVVSFDVPLEAGLVYTRPVDEFEDAQAIIDSYASGEVTDLALLSRLGESVSR